MNTLARLLVAFGGLLLADASLAGGTGHVIHNGVRMPIKAGVAVWDPDRPALAVYLLPFGPTPDEVAACRGGGMQALWKLERASPDKKRWANWVPFASIGISWFDKAEVPDLDKEWIDLYTFSIDKHYTNMNVNFAVSGHDGTLRVDGEMAVGEQVTVEASGVGGIGDKDKLSWDFEVTTTVLAADRSR